MNGPLTHDALEALRLARRRPDVSIKRLAEEVGVATHILNGRFYNLYGKGLLDTVRVGSGLYHLTPEGEAALRQPAEVRAARGMNLREALRLAEEMGCRVEPLRRTGELRVSCQGRGTVVLNRRRKDAPVKLTAMLDRLQRAAHVGGRSGSVP